MHHICVRRIEEHHSPAYTAARRETLRQAAQQCCIMVAPALPSAQQMQYNTTMPCTFGALPLHRQDHCSNCTFASARTVREQLVLTCWCSLYIRCKQYNCNSKTQPCRRHTTHAAREHIRRGSMTVRLVSSWAVELLGRKAAGGEAIQLS